MTIENCSWCTKPFEKVRTIIYCSDDCREECIRQRLNARRHDDYYIIPLEKVGLDYADYDPEANQRLIDQHTVITVQPKPTLHDPIKVPIMKFKRFKEPKNIIVFTQRQEKRRSTWRDI